MENSLHETCVKFMVAKLLKVAGFDWDCKYVYDLIFPTSCENNEVCSDFSDKNPNKFSDLVSAPTLEIVQKWLREVKGIHICVKPDAASINCKYFVTVIISDTKWGNVQDENNKPILFNTYEEAQEAGIKKVLEIILKK